MSNDLTIRPQRLRKNQFLRDMVADVKLDVDDLMYPIFVVHGKNIKSEIKSMPGQYHWSLDLLPEIIEKVVSLKIPAIMIFGIPKTKDDLATENYDPNGIVQQAVKLIKTLAPKLIIATDICLCSFTPHGHCGVVIDNCISNDSTLEILKKTAVSHAKAGADIVAPSGMMDGMVFAMRESLDIHGFTNILIMSYSIKYASAFYGPFRSACDSGLKGDRKSYQMDYRNIKEACKEAQLDESQGADIIMIKPALSYLDIISLVKSQTLLPVAAYQVSGEYSMIKAAAANNFIDEREITIETLTSIKRAGASIILSYSAIEAAQWLKS